MAMTLTQKEVDHYFEVIEKMPKGREFITHMLAIINENQNLRKRARELHKLVMLANEMSKELMEENKKLKAILNR
jgi:hypothetical protein